MSTLRHAKHIAFVRRKKARFAYRRYKFGLATLLFGRLGQWIPYRYRQDGYTTGRHGLPWLRNDVPVDQDGQCPRRVFVVWTGRNQMSANRERSLRRLREVVGVDVVLVTPDNLDEWVIPGHPLHPAYEQLSLVHRSDYLRGYLMHHHGGGYSDVKEPIGSWIPCFEQIEADDACWVLSYRATHANWIGKLRGRAGRTLLFRYRLVFGKGSFLMRSHTPLTAEWVARMDEILDAERDSLLSNPGEVFGAPGYALSWTDLLSRVLDPLTLKFHDHIRYDDRMLLKFEDYR